MRKEHKAKTAECILRVRRDPESYRDLAHVAGKIFFERKPQIMPSPHILPRNCGILLHGVCNGPYGKVFYIHQHMHGRFLCILSAKVHHAQILLKVMKTRFSIFPHNPGQVDTIGQHLYAQSKKSYHKLLTRNPDALSLITFFSRI